MTSDQPASAPERNPKKTSWEKAYPFVGAVVLTILWRLCVTARTLESVNLANAVLTVIAILVGFLGTALTLLLTAPNHPAIEKFKTAPQYNNLIEFMWNGIRLGLVEVILCLVAMAPKQHGWLGWEDIFECVWFFVMVWSVIAFYRAVSILVELIT